MKSSPENFQDLLKLMDVKRQESPPPRFFDGFSERVITEIQITPTPAKKSRWQHLADEVQGRPLLAAVYALVVCGAVITGVMLAQSGNVRVKQTPEQRQALEMGAKPALLTPADLTRQKRAETTGPAESSASGTALPIPAPSMSSTLKPVLDMESSLSRSNELLRVRATQLLEKN